MRLVLILAMLASPAVAAPDSIVWKSEGVEVTLHKSPCVNPTVLSQVHPSNHKLFQAGQAVFEGAHKVAGCWAIQPDQTGEVQVWFIDEMGAFGTLSREKFAPK